MSELRKFAVWEAFDGPWDAKDIRPPDLTVNARDFTHAAELFAAREPFRDEAAVIVRDEVAGSYVEIELIKIWETDLYKPTTLDELCAPR